MDPSEGRMLTIGQKDRDRYVQPARIGSIGFWVLGLSMMLCVTACGDKGRSSSRPPEAQVATSASQPTASADFSTSGSMLEEPTVAGYIYTPVGKRDPFKSFYKVERKPSEESPGGILTKFEIDQLKLTAIISGIAKPRAQVELPDGRGVSVQVGTRVGKNYGRVVRIKTGEVIIAEDYRDWSGRKVTNYIHMKLRRETNP